MSLVKQRYQYRKSRTLLSQLSHEAIFTTHWLIQAWWMRQHLHTQPLESLLSVLAASSIQQHGNETKVPPGQLGSLVVLAKTVARAMTNITPYGG